MTVGCSPIQSHTSSGAISVSSRRTWATHWCGEDFSGFGHGQEGGRKEDGTGQRQQGYVLCVQTPRDGERQGDGG